MSNDYKANEVIIRELLTPGGYGVVYKGEIKGSRRIVALKTLITTRYKSKEEYDQQFNEEVVNNHYVICCHIFFVN